MYRLARALRVFRRLATERVPIRLSELAQEQQPRRGWRYVAAQFDVERSPEHALYFAEEVRKVGIVGTFYFQTRRSAYCPRVLRAIAGLGHEVGYHYECLDRCQGDFAAARQLFLDEVALFRHDGIELATACSHSELGIQRNGYRSNADLLQRYPDLLRQAGLIGESTAIARPHRKALAVDTFRAYCRLWHTIRFAQQERVLLHVWIHPHRWHEQVRDTVREVARDLQQYARNWMTGNRTYRTVTLAGREDGDAADDVHAE